MSEATETYQFPPDFKLAEVETVVTSEKPGRLRWRKSHDWAVAPVLQQLWHITIYRGGAPVDMEEEWRDVPLEDEA